MSNTGTYTGLHRQTGGAVADAAHLAQSVADILTTPLGSRVMRRSYGSNLFDLIDGSANAAGHLRLIAASATALMRWEPRLRLSQITTDVGLDGRASIDIIGKAFDRAQTISLGLTQ